MSVFENIRSLVEVFKASPASNELSIIESLLRHEEPQIALEAICDILIDHRIYLCDCDVQKIKILTSEMHLSPSTTWEGLLVWDEQTHQPKFVLQFEIEWKEDKQALESILHEIKSQLTDAEAQEIDEYIEVGEYELAIDTLLYCIKTRQLLIAKKSWELLENIAQIYNVPINEEY